MEDKEETLGWDDHGNLRRGKFEKRDRKGELKHILDAEARSIKEKGMILYIIDAIWIEQWLSFVKHDSAPIPGRISNNRLLNEEQQLIQLKTGLEIVKDYRCVTKEVWEVYVALYGGGPVITTPYTHRKAPDTGKWIVQMDGKDGTVVLAKAKRRSSFKRMMAATEVVKGYMESAHDWLHQEEQAQEAPRNAETETKLAKAQHQDAVSGVI